MTQRLFLKCTFLSLLILCGCTESDKANKRDSNSQLESVSVRLPIPVPDASFAPFYLGQDKGFFADYGLRVELKPGTSQLNPVNMVDQDADDFGIVGGPELLISARNNGASIKAIALMHYKSNFVVLLTKKGSGLTTLDDLDGKRVGFYYGHISTDVLRSLFRQENISIEEVDVGFNYSRFISGQIPAQWAFRTTAGITLPERGVEVNQISPAEYGITTHGHTLIASNNTISKRPEMVDAFVDALTKSTRYALSNSDEVIKATLKRDKEGNLTKNIVRQQWKIYSNIIRNSKRIGYIYPDAINNTLDRLVNIEEVGDTIKVRNIYTNDFIMDKMDQ